jgi:D-3-phosphoglycerate dehydrogenase
MKPKIVIAETIAQAGVDLLAQRFDVDVAVGLDRSKLLGRLADAAGLIVRSATTVDADMIAAAPSLKVIGRAGIGVDNIDLTAATERGVLVVNAPNANTISAAEQTMALMLSQARNTPQAHAKLVAGIWDRKSFQGVELHGKTVGIIGLGKIGTLVAQRCAAFGMKVCAHDPFVTEDRARRLGVELVDLDTLLGQADFISIHLPKTPETENLIGGDNISKLKRGVRIINTSRGGVVNESELARAIEDGIVAGAGLDVFEAEPTTDSPLFSLRQVVVTPHLGASTAEAQDKAGTDVAEAVAAALAGELVLSAVNVDLGPEVTEEVRAFLPVAENLGRAFVGLARGISGPLTVRAEGRIAGQPIRPLKLAVLKGLLEAVTDDPVSYVNAPSMAEGHGISVDVEATEQAQDYVSSVRVTGHGAAGEIALAGTLSKRGPVMVEVADHDVELLFSQHVLVVRNSDTPGVIGRVGTYLGARGINIDNMVVGQSRATGMAAMMGVNVDRALTEEELDAIRALDGIEEATYLTFG